MPRVRAQPASAKTGRACADHHSGAGEGREQAGSPSLAEAGHGEDGRVRADDRVEAATEDEAEEQNQ
jgi:hypothetical protein